MPINAILDRYTRGRGMPRIGVLHKGAARTDDDLARKRPGKDLDYFRVAWADNLSLTPDELDRIFQGLYGAQPKMIAPIYMLGETPDECLSMWYEEWGKSGLHHRCDGDNQTSWFNSDTGRIDNAPKPCAVQGKGCQCKQIARLNFFSREFMRYSREAGYFTVQTHGMSDIDHLHSVLMDAYALAGTLKEVPFMLTRTPKDFEIPELDKHTGKATGKRITVKKSVLFLRIAPDFIGQLAAGENAPAQLEGGQNLPALPAQVAEPRWTEAQARAWKAETQERTGLSNADILQALGVNALGAWSASTTAATRAINRWIDEQMQNNALEGEVIEE